MVSYFRKEGTDMEEYLKIIDGVIARGRFKDTWESLSQYRAPEWYERAKLGIFIHWGVYSVPAFGSEWYSRNMYIRGTKEFEHHVKTWGPQKEFGYKDFIPLFKAEKFDPAEWAELFRAAGARYVVPVAEHHDGFQMYQSRLSHWNAFEMGPRRDVLGELTAEFEKRGLVPCASSHRVEHWFFMGHGKEFDSDIREPLRRGDLYWPSMPEREHFDQFSEPRPTREFLEDWLCRCCELVDRYRPRLVYFDWWIMHEAVKPYLRKFAAYYYNRADEWGQGVVINYKQDCFVFGTAVPDVERGQFKDAKPYIWQSDTSVAKNSWGYTENNSYKTPAQIVRDLTDIVSKNGRLLLNIGPRADGTIPEEDRSILLAVGEWMRVNGEAIDGAKPWRVSGEGPTAITEGQFADSEDKGYTAEDIRFTANHGKLYAACLNARGRDTVRIRTLAQKDASHAPNFHSIVRKVEILGGDAPLSWERDGECMTVHLPETVETDMPVVFRITLD